MTIRTLTLSPALDYSLTVKDKLTIGAINRKNMYKISCEQACEKDNVCTVRLDDNTEYHLSAKMWNQVITQGLKKCGYIGSQNLKSVVVRQCEC